MIILSDFIDVSDFLLFKRCARLSCFSFASAAAAAAASSGVVWGELGSVWPFDAGKDADSAHRKLQHLLQVLGSPRENRRHWAYRHCR
jgi:hypothetical protein